MKDPMKKPKTLIPGVNASRSCPQTAIGQPSIFLGLPCHEYSTPSFRVLRGSIEVICGAQLSVSVHLYQATLLIYSIAWLCEASLQ